MRSFAFLLMLAAVASYGQTRRTPDPGADVADDMVVSVKSASAGSGSSVNNNPLIALTSLGQLSEEERKRLDDVNSKIIAVSREITGESFSGRESLNLSMGLNTWLTSHKTNLDKYEARARKIDKRLLTDWQAAQEKLGVQQGQLTLVLFGIIIGTFDRVLPIAQRHVTK